MKLRWGPLAGLAAAAASVVPAGCSASAPRPASSGTVGCYTYSVTTGRSSYRRGRPVAVTVTGRNSSGRACVPPGCAGTSGGYSVTTGSGRAVYTRDPAGAECTYRPLAPAAVPAGGRFVLQSFSWNAAAPPGTYRIAWRWLGEVRATSAQFRIRR